MKKILVPVDFSDQASHALNFAIEFNEKLQGEIILVHVIEVPAGYFSLTEISAPQVANYYKGELIEEANNKLNEWSDRVSTAGQKVSVFIKYGNAFTNISKLIAEEDASYIIMGSKGASGLKEIFIGSNAERMIRFAKCPVFIIKGETHIKDMKNFVFTSDLSEEQDLIAYHAKEMQDLLGLNMHVVKVKTPYNWLEDVQVKKQLERFAERNYLKDYTLNTYTADFADEGAIKFAEENDAGLIVMGTHGRRGLAHFIGKSIAEDVVNESKIPILVYKIWD
ncbi:MAG: universal stress protein [Bacteroidota bacterium]